jgi:hypothetical protein
VLKFLHVRGEEASSSAWTSVMELEDFLIAPFWLAWQPVKKQLRKRLTLAVDDEIWGLLGYG